MFTITLIYGLIILNEANWSLISSDLSFQDWSIDLDRKWKTMMIPSLLSEFLINIEPLILLCHITSLVATGKPDLDSLVNLLHVIYLLDIGVSSRKWTKKALKISLLYLSVQSCLVRLSYHKAFFIVVIASNLLVGYGK